MAHYVFKCEDHDGDGEPIGPVYFYPDPKTSVACGWSRMERARARAQAEGVGFVDDDEEALKILQTAEVVAAFDAHFSPRRTRET